jgi:hypothetical protein
MLQISFLNLKFTRRNPLQMYRTTSQVTFNSEVFNMSYISCQSILADLRLNANQNYGTFILQYAQHVLCKVHNISHFCIQHKKEECLKNVKHYFVLAGLQNVKWNTDREYWSKIDTVKVKYLKEIEVLIMSIILRILFFMVISSLLCGYQLKMFSTHRS